MEMPPEQKDITSRRNDYPCSLKAEVEKLLYVVSELQSSIQEKDARIAELERLLAGDSSIPNSSAARGFLQPRPPPAAAPFLQVPRGVIAPAPKEAARSRGAGTVQSPAASGGDDGDGARGGEDERAEGTGRIRKSLARRAANRNALAAAAQNKSARGGDGSHDQALEEEDEEDDEQSADENEGQDKPADSMMLARKAITRQATPANMNDMGSGVRHSSRNGTSPLLLEEMEDEDPDVGDNMRGSLKSDKGGPVSPDASAALSSPTKAYLPARSQRRLPTAIENTEAQDWGEIHLKESNVMVSELTLDLSLLGKSSNTNHHQTTSREAQSGTPPSRPSHLPQKRLPNRHASKGDSQAPALPTYQQLHPQARVKKGSTEKEDGTSSLAHRHASRGDAQDAAHHQYEHLHRPVSPLQQEMIEEEASASSPTPPVEYRYSVDAQAFEIEAKLVMRETPLGSSPKPPAEASELESKNIVWGGSLDSTAKPSVSLRSSSDDYKPVSLPTRSSMNSRSNNSSRQTPTRGTAANDDPEVPRTPSSLHDEPRTIVWEGLPGVSTSLRATSDDYTPVSLPARRRGVEDVDRNVTTPLRESGSAQYVLECDDVVLTPALVDAEQQHQPNGQEGTAAATRGFASSEHDSGESAGEQATPSTEQEQQRRRRHRAGGWENDIVFDPKSLEDAPSIDTGDDLRASITVARRARALPREIELDFLTD